MSVACIPRVLCTVLLAFATPGVAAAVAPVAVTLVDQPAIAAALQGQARGRLKDFYAARGYQPLWAATGRLSPAAAILRGFVADADLDGLKPRDYKLGRLDKALAAAEGGDPREVARAELRLSETLARYVQDQRKRGDADMNWLDLRLKPVKLQPDAVLRAAALPEPFADYVSAMGWMSPHYVRLREYTRRARDGGADEDARHRLGRNLDRARLLPGPWTRHVVVDAASGRLWYYQAGRRLGSMKVVVGRPETPTPMLAGMLQYAILNPYWNVPVDLAQTLVAPRVLGGKSLKAMGYEALSDWSATPARLAPAAIDWRAVAAGTQELRLRQLPGAGNSMGRVKFMFPNDDGIYLHDTPDRQLFAAADRHFSNGCVRLENAATLGKWLLGRSIGSSGRAPEQAVPLPVEVPIYLTYLTADEAGFRDDIYDRDR